MSTIGRTPDEILRRIKDRENADFFGFETDNYISALPFEQAKPYLKEGVTEEEWGGLTPTDLRAQMIDYLDFAFEKARNERGLSACRSIMHYVAWLWLTGDEEAEQLSESIQNYYDYGAPQLLDICKYLGVDPREHGYREVVNG